MKNATPSSTRPTSPLRRASRPLAGSIAALLLCASGLAFAGSATWKLMPGTGDWNTAANWTPATVPNSSGDTATFDVSNTTAISLSAATQVVTGFFSSNASAYTITTGAFSLTFNAAGINNLSGITQNFVTGPGVIIFTNGATAGSLTRFTNNGGAVFTGFERFFNNSTAGSGTFINNGGAAAGASGGDVEFMDTSTAANGIFTNNGATASGATGGRVYFQNTSTAGSGVFTNNGGTVSGAGGGFTQFIGGSGANGTFTSNAGAVAGAGGGYTEFLNTSTAGAATLIANGGPGTGGSILFKGDSLGGTSRIEVFGTGNLDISGHNAPGVSAGSIEGTGKILLGARNLTVGGNGLNTTFSGVIQGAGGSLTLAGGGSAVLTLSGATNNTYTGLTTVDSGLLAMTKPAGFIAVPGNLSLMTGTAEFGNNNLNPIGGTTITIDNGLLEADTAVNLTQALVLNGRASFFGNGNSTLSGVISGIGSFRSGSFGGASSLSVTNNANSYGGGTELESGTLFVDANNALGTGPLTVTSVSTLASHLGGVIIPNPVVIQSDFSIAPASGGLTLSGNVDLGAATHTITNTTTVQNSAFTVFFSGAISGAGGLTLAAPLPGPSRNYFRFSGTTANTYGGVTTVRSQTILDLAKTAGVNAIPGDLVIDLGGLVQTFAANQISPTAMVMDNGEFNLAAFPQTVGTLDGSGRVELSSTGILTAGAGNFSGILEDNPSLPLGQLVKSSAGALILTGANTYTGNTTINGGVLSLDGSLKSANVLINPGGQLAGIGTAFGNVVNNGLLSPGHSPGTFHIGGNYTQLSGGTLQIEVAGTQPGQFDVLAVGGHASLDGTLRIVNVGGVKLKVGDQLAILTAGGGVSGKFSTVVNPFATGTIIGTGLIYEANEVLLVLTQNSFLQLGGLTPNQRAVARALDRVAFDTRETKLIDFLDGEPLGKLPADLDRIAPEELASVFNLSAALANVQTANLERRMDDLRAGTSGFSASGFAMSGSAGSSSGGFAGATGPEGKGGKVMVPAADNRWGVFVTGVGEFAKIGDTANARGYDLTTGGFTLGVDYKLTPNFALGVNAGYARTGLNLNHGGRITVDGGKLGLYATYFTGGFYADAAVSGGLNGYSTRRSALRGDARGSENGGELNALFATGYDWKVGALTLGPTASFQYTYASLGSFTETGSLAPLHYGSQHGESLRSALGAKASYDWKIGGVLIRPEVRASWQHEYGTTAYAINSSFANGGGAFTTHGPETGRDSLLLGAGFAVQWNDRTSTYVYYDGEIARSNFDSHNISGGVRFAF